MSQALAPIDPRVNTGSRVFIVGANGDFTNTMKQNVTATDGGTGTWDCVGVKNLAALANNDLLIVRLRCTGSPSRLPPLAPPTTGTLTVTIANTGAGGAGTVIVQISVGYVDDGLP